MREIDLATPTDTAPIERSILRHGLLADRKKFAAGAEAAAAVDSLARQLRQVLGQLEPGVMGLYWPLRSEFNAATAIAADSLLAKLPAALPFARRSPIALEYRLWDGLAPGTQDECGIPTAQGPVVVPDVVVVPCLGYTDDNFRLGYGGGYFDRWLASHPETTTVGVAWSFARIAPGVFRPLAHDQPLTLMVTERGVS